MKSKHLNEHASSSKGILLFAPVIHSGYLEFIKRYDGDVWIFGHEIIADYVHLTRDLRTIDPEAAKNAISSIFPDRKIFIASPKDLAAWPYSHTVMPDDEVCHDIALKYFGDKKIEYSSVFLRWNRVITFKENEIPAHRKITKEKMHKEIMKEAFVEAQKSSDWWRQIAAIIVKDGKIIEKTHNHHMPSDFHLSVNGDPRSNFNAGEHQDIFTSIHAEAESIAKAAKGGVSLDGASIYSTTFPCPNCARLIGTAGIKKVYYSKGYSLLDAEKILNHFGVEIIMVDEK